MDSRILTLVSVSGEYSTNITEHRLKNKATIESIKYTMWSVLTPIGRVKNNAFSNVDFQATKIIDLSFKVVSS